MQKQVLAIHDLSCVGRCSLTVALPVLSACGLHTSALPTALLSTHTGEFTGYTCLDLTQEMEKIAAHFATLPLRFDGLYTGFLGSFEQIQLVGNVLEKYHRQDTLTLVDPVMADHGRLYATYTQAMAEGMGALCRLADVIVPNLTEACILLHRPYDPAPGWNAVRNMMEELCRRFGCKQVIITGVEQNGLLGASGFCADTGETAFAGGEKLPGIFYGTGDVLASGLMGGLMQGLSMEKSLFAAVRFTHAAMEHTLTNGLPLRYGVAFEQALPLLMREIGVV